MMKLEILDEWAKVNYVEDILKMRDLFYYQNGHNAPCTCDKCAMVTICALAYDGYNTNGDCLYDK